MGRKQLWCDKEKQGIRDDYKQNKEICNIHDQNNYSSLTSLHEILVEPTDWSDSWICRIYINWKSNLSLDYVEMLIEPSFWTTTCDISIVWNIVAAIKNMLTIMWMRLSWLIRGSENQHILYMTWGWAMGLDLLKSDCYINIKFQSTDVLSKLIHKCSSGPGKQNQANNY